jgi:alkanesulfonate monooxygenase SsuD/methylene tetrahydromethanopterin reductase-like flavin-dependent oxidoreductase (luciferase family)
MREYILALQSIWAAWNDQTRLDFEGEFYRHTLMTPFFAPTPNPFGAPKVFLAAVGAKMTEVAGEVADGIIIHGFTTERYVKEVTMPAVERFAVRVALVRRSGLRPVVRRHRSSDEELAPPPRA